MPFEAGSGRYGKPVQAKDAQWEANGSWLPKSAECDNRNGDRHKLRADMGLFGAAKVGHGPLFDTYDCLVCGSGSNFHREMAPSESYGSNSGLRAIWR